MDVLMTAVAAWFLAQLMKVLSVRIVEGRFDLATFWASGGMPSSHTAFVTATAVRIALVEGIRSPLFGLSVVLALVVMHDAAGVRHSVGMQARTLNKIQEELRGLVAFDVDVIKEVLGHTGTQVFAGFTLGLITGFASAWFPFP